MISQISVEDSKRKLLSKNLTIFCAKNITVGLSTSSLAQYVARHLWDAWGSGRVKLEYVLTDSDQTELFESSLT